MNSLQAIIIRSIVRRRVGRFSGVPSVEVIRAALDALGAQSPVHADVQQTPVEINGMRGIWLIPPNAPPNNVLLYLHGGAYVAGSIQSHANFISYMAKVAGIRTLLVEYRLAPENLFPAALDDAMSAYRWLIDKGTAPDRIVIGGDSAGGGLTLALLVKLRDLGMALPKGAVLLSPWTDLAATGDSLRTRARQDPWLKPESVAPGARVYYGSASATDPLVSPLYADLKGLPPILIQVGDFEILLNDSTRVADKIRAAGGQVDLQIWPGMWHVFQSVTMQMPESRRAIQKIGAFINANLTGHEIR